MSTFLKLNDVTLPGSGYPKIGYFLTPAVPVVSGLLGSYKFVKSSAISSKNYANAESPLSIVGDPAFDPAFGAVLDYQNCFDTQIASTLDKTMIVVAKAPGDSGYTEGTIIASDYEKSDTGSHGDALSLSLLSGNPRITLYGGRSTATTPIPLGITGGVTPGDWTICTGRITSAGEMTLIVGSGGNDATTARSYGDRGVSSRSLIIGGHHYNNFAGKNRVAFAGIYNRALSDSEINQVHTYLRQYFSRIGITTL